jgi:predicted DNA-binding protein (MmcQ/YjbR family)
MDRENIIAYIKDKYNVEPEHLWDKYPNYVVFRNPETRKRF